MLRRKAVDGADFEFFFDALVPFVSVFDTVSAVGIST